MKDRRLWAPLGLALIAVAIAEGGLAWLVAWPGSNLLALGIAHQVRAHRLFGKRADGTLPLWSRVAFLPLFAGVTASWLGARFLRGGPAFSPITDALVLGRRPGARELEGRFDNVVDLTAEFSEPGAIRRLAAYRAFPVLNASAPDPEALQRAVRALRPGRTFVHCAEGRGRSAMFAMAVLLASGTASSVDDALRMVRAARPNVRLSAVQLHCLRQYAMRGAPA